MVRSHQELCDRRIRASSRLPAVSLIAGLTLIADLPEAQAQGEVPFKFMNVHFETNASGCDMGAQILFDTDGVTEVEIEDPDGNVVFSSEAALGLEETHDQTEGFQERVEPPIIEFEQALGCDLSPDAISLDDILSAWPAGKYEFSAESGGVEFEGTTTLTHRIPAGPEITAPEDGTVVRDDQPLVIRWEKVTAPIIPSLGPVRIVGYHVLMKDVTSGTQGPLLPAAFDVDVPGGETSVVVPAEYLQANRIYEFEVLATERGGNQTITEGGAVCTVPIRPAHCELP